MENETKNELITGAVAKTDNELIAEFMEFPYERTGLTFSEPRTLVVSKAKLEYHTSWDWLMPVIGKISKTEPMNQSWYDIKYALTEANIESSYNCVVRFIKWYNETQSRDGGN